MKSAWDVAAADFVRRERQAIMRHDFSNLLSVIWRKGYKPKNANGEFRWDSGITEQQVDRKFSVYLYVQITPAYGQITPIHAGPFLLVQKALALHLAIRLKFTSRARSTLRGHLSFT